MLIPTDGRLPQTSQTPAIDHGRIAAIGSGPQVGAEPPERLPVGVTPVEVVFRVGWDQQKVCQQLT